VNFVDFKMHGATIKIIIVVVFDGLSWKNLFYSDVNETSEGAERSVG